MSILEICAIVDLAFDVVRWLVETVLKIKKK